MKVLLYIRCVINVILPNLQEHYVHTLNTNEYT